MKYAAMIASLLVFALWAGHAPALAQGTAQAKVATQCKNEIAQFCQDKTQGEALRTCLGYHLDIMSDNCKTAFKAMKSAANTAPMGSSGHMAHMSDTGHMGNSGHMGAMGGQGSMH